jgi:hypothetical protein
VSVYPGTKVINAVPLLVILISRSGRKSIQFHFGAKYDVMLFKGDQHLNKTHTVENTGTEDATGVLVELEIELL